MSIRRTIVDHPTDKNRQEKHDQHPMAWNKICAKSLRQNVCTMRHLAKLVPGTNLSQDGHGYIIIIVMSSSGATGGDQCNRRRLREQPQLKVMPKEARQKSKRNRARTTRVEETQLYIYIYVLECHLLGPGPKP